MDKDTEVTEVIFRKFKDGEIIALFPYIVERKFGNCSSYMHIGQHSGATLDLIRTTKLATEDEYKPLYDELTKQVGYNLKVFKKINWAKYRKAYNEYKAKLNTLI